MYLLDYEFFGLNVAVNEIRTPVYDPDVHTAELTAEIPADAEYVYVRAEDYAGNVTVVRHYFE